MPNANKRFCVLVLAAGKGTRMHSKTPKVLQQILEEPILGYTLRSAAEAGFADTAVVVGFGGEDVEAWLGTEFPDVKIIWQREQLGTGHAVKLAEEWWRGYDCLMVLTGDTPLITPETLKNFADGHISGSAQCTFLSFEPDDPAGYGRVIHKDGRVSVVEDKDASPEDKKCREVNSGMYVFDTQALASVIDKIGCANRQKEYYLPDALTLIQENGGRAVVVKAASPYDFIGINDPLQLAEAASVMRGRILRKWMKTGVRCMDPASTWIGPKVRFGQDITIEPNVQLWGKSSVGDGSRIGSFSILRGAELGADVTIVGSVRINNCRVEEGASVGPFVLLRDGAVISKGASVGRFVEIKNSTVCENSKVPHLSYIGDAVIGKNTNIGAGTITCNYDGTRKNHTSIGENCLVGSDTMFVAPVNVGNDAMTAAGSVITCDIPDGALAIGRARQKNLDGYSRRKRNINVSGK